MRFNTRKWVKPEDLNANETLFAGALLLTPGFFTDALGLSLMVPGVRSRVFQFIRKRVVVQDFRYGTAERPSETVIDADYEDLDAPKGPSGWTRH